MFLSAHRRIAALLAVALVLPLAVSPAFADSKSPFQNSLGGIVKVHDRTCEMIKFQRDVAQDEADDNEGTIKGLSAQTRADNLTEKGADTGCAWAS